MNRSINKFILNDSGPVAGSSLFNKAINHTSNIFGCNSIFTWIPKNGCSNLRYSCAVHNKLIDESTNPNWIHPNNGIFKSSLKELFEAKCTFVYLRCPYERILSCFLDKFIDSPNTENFHEILIDSDFYKIHHLGNKTNVSEINFLEFVEFVVNSRVENIHWDPQWTFLVYEEYDYYFNIADGLQSYEFLYNEIGFKVYDTRNVIKHDRSHYRNIDCEDAFLISIHNLIEMKSKGMIPSTASFMNKQIKEKIDNFYSLDFQLLRRCKRF